MTALADVNAEQNPKDNMTKFITCQNDPRDNGAQLIAAKAQGPRTQQNWPPLTDPIRPISDLTRPGHSQSQSVDAPLGGAGAPVPLWRVHQGTMRRVCDPPRSHGGGIRRRLVYRHWRGGEGEKGDTLGLAA